MSEEQNNSEVEDFQAKYLRAVADMDNLRKRLVRQVDEAHLFAPANFMSKILMILDDLDRGISGFGNEEVANFLTMIRGRIASELMDHGCAEIKAKKGMPFDPNCHEAMMQKTSHEKKGAIIEVVKKGYTLHERVLRPAVVIVSGGPEER